MPLEELTGEDPKGQYVTALAVNNVAALGGGENGGDHMRMCMGGGRALVQVSVIKFRSLYTFNDNEVPYLAR